MDFAGGVGVGGGGGGVFGLGLVWFWFVWFFFISVERKHLLHKVYPEEHCTSESRRVCGMLWLSCKHRG